MMSSYHSVCPNCISVCQSATWCRTKISWCCYCIRVH